MGNYPSYLLGLGFQKWYERGEGLGECLWVGDLLSSKRAIKFVLVREPFKKNTEGTQPHRGGVQPEALLFSQWTVLPSPTSTPKWFFYTQCR